MIEARDWRIIYKLIDQLKLITTDNEYNTDIKTVQIARKTLDIKAEQYPIINIYLNDFLKESQDMQSENGKLNLLLIYEDGNQEKDTDLSSFIERLRFVAPDIKKCINQNTSLDNECIYVNIDNQFTGLYPVELGNGIIDLREAVVTQVSIDRDLDLYDPYL